ncbi:hypothetical protein EVG20_g951 [Dentipellis fragilis]|uniref:Uncharacterized protein n=1 Tax=Dentipellis fragilis TaxID=205917 RepID=A0A4Y9ZE58_9AGAM|nr:hypothetical protein EVG20_g951 [Dentipellis fragilis]
MPSENGNGENGGARKKYRYGEDSHGRSVPLQLQPLPFTLTYTAAGLTKTMRTSFFSFVSFFVAVVSGQQLITTTDALGNTIIEEVTTDALGDPITEILQTIASVPTPSVPVASTPRALSTSSLTSTTPVAAPVQQGPVGQPGPTAAQGETPYTYTTTDANGDPTAIQDVFTPTFPATTPADIPATGTVLDFSQWLGMIGNATSDLNKPVGTQVVDGGSVNRPLSIACSLLAGIAAGAALVLS